MRIHPVACAGVLIAGIVACAAPTHLRAVWHAPDVSGVRFDKLLVVGVTPDETRRRAIETNLVGRVKNGTASYEVLSTAETKDADRAKAKVVSLGFDGALVVRFVGTRQETTYVPGSTYWGPAPYGSMWGYWGYGWGAVYDPGYMVTDTVVTLESNVYSIPRDELIWSSRSETISPSSIDSLMDSVIAATVKEMKRKKVLS